MPDIFSNGRELSCQETDAEKDELFKQIGQLKVELDFLKKKGLVGGNLWLLQGVPIIGEGRGEWAAVYNTRELVAP